MPVLSMPQCTGSSTPSPSQLIPNSLLIPISDIPSMSINHIAGNRHCQHFFYLNSSSTFPLKPLSTFHHNKLETTPQPFHLFLNKLHLYFSMFPSHPQQPLLPPSAGSLKLHNHHLLHLLLGLPSPIPLPTCSASNIFSPLLLIISTTSSYNTTPLQSTTISLSPPPTPPSHSLLLLL